MAVEPTLTSNDENLCFMLKAGLDFPRQIPRIRAAHSSLWNDDALLPRQASSHTQNEGHFTMAGHRRKSLLTSHHVGSSCPSSRSPGQGAMLSMQESFRHGVHLGELRVPNHCGEISGRRSSFMLIDRLRNGLRWRAGELYA